MPQQTSCHFKLLCLALSFMPIMGSVGSPWLYFHLGLPPTTTPPTFLPHAHTRILPPTVNRTTALRDGGRADGLGGQADMGNVADGQVIIRQQSRSDARG